MQNLTCASLGGMLSTARAGTPRILESTMKLVLPLFLAACQDYSLEKLPAEDGAGPGIEVSPTTVVFGDLGAGETTTETFRITSVGSASLTVQEVNIASGEAFTITSMSGGVPGRYAVEEFVDVTVTYTSTGAEDYGQALVLSDDSDDPEVYVDLVGGVAFPELTIDPSAVDFGATALGNPVSAQVDLRNTGEATLTITEIVETDNVFSHALADSLPISLEAGEESTVTVTFDPSSEGFFTGEMQVTSNDPEGVKSATLEGEVGSQPIASCYADPAEIEAIHEEATWVGTDSSDPNGYAITGYSWTLVSAPSGSSATMPSGSGANRRGFTADVVGTYTAQLVVTNELGEDSEPALCDLEAIPGGDLWIEMFWAQSNDDMDLHLLAPGGSMESNTDCYYANCTYGGLDWGVRGDSSDNPSLDLDDIPGTGPENINISDPDAGTYTVVVNDYTGSTPDYQGANSVTVNVYVGGVLEWTDTRNISGDGSDEYFCEIDWPSGTVTSR